MSDVKEIAEIPSFTVKLSIRRFDPEKSEEASWQEYEVEMHSTDRVLDALHKIKWEQDGSLTFRRSCAHGVCGSDAVRINGRNRLACKTLIKDLDINSTITVEPIKGLPVEKDLIVDMNPFYQAYKDINPFLVANDKPEKERLQSPRGLCSLRRHHEVHSLCRLHHLLPCILDRRSILRSKRAIVNGHRFIFDFQGRKG
jgi:succinate dehydrogenase and fumarate reductase iron-sulfur protein